MLFLIITFLFTENIVVCVCTSVLCKCMRSYSTWWAGIWTIFRVSYSINSACVSHSLLDLLAKKETLTASRTDECSETRVAIEMWPSGILPLSVWQLPPGRPVRSWGGGGEERRGEEGGEKGGQTVVNLSTAQMAAGSHTGDTVPVHTRICCYAGERRVRFSISVMRQVEHNTWTVSIKVSLSWVGLKSVNKQLGRMSKTISRD